MSTGTPESDAAFTAAAIQLVSVVADTVVGYRQRLVDGGVPDAVADDMAREFHTVMMEQVRSAREQQTRAGKMGRR